MSKSSRGSFDSLTVERLLEFAGECRARIRALSAGRSPDSLLA